MIFDILNINRYPTLASRIDRLKKEKDFFRTWKGKGNQNIKLFFFYGKRTFGICTVFVGLPKSRKISFPFFKRPPNIFLEEFSVEKKNKFKIWRRRNSEDSNPLPIKIPTLYSSLSERHFKKDQPEISENNQKSKSKLYSNRNFQQDKTNKFLEIFPFSKKS